MTTLTDFEFELGGIAMGPSRSIVVEKLDRSGFEVRNQDAPGVQGDWQVFGRDYKTPGTWSFNLYTNTSSASAAYDLIDQLATIWDAAATRATQQAVLPLRYARGGVTRVVYGRPRRFTVVDQYAAQGRIAVVADFVLADTGSYADTANNVTIGVGPATLTGTGVTFPCSFPKIWGGASGAPLTKQLVIGGTRPTWVTLTFHGPTASGTATRPYVTINGTTFQLTGTLAQNGVITVDPSPWGMGIYNGDGSAASSALSPSSRLSMLRLAPGTYSVTYGGIDTTGTSNVTASWRSAYTSI